MIDVERVDFIGVPVRDLAEADAYFRDTLALFERDPRSSDRWVEYDAPNVTLALVPEAYKPGGHEPLPFASVVVRVDDLDGERGRLAERGVAFAGDGFDSGVCNGAPFVALDGNGMMLHRRTRRSRTASAGGAPRPRRLRGGAGARPRPGRGVLRRRARPRAQPALDGHVGRVRDVEPDAGAGRSGHCRAGVQAVARRHDRVPRRRRRGGQGRARGGRRGVPRGIIDSGSVTWPRSPIPTATV